MSQGAQALLRKLIDDPRIKPRLVDEARGTLAILSYAGIDDCGEAIIFLLGMLAGLQDRIDALERAKRRSP